MASIIIMVESVTVMREYVIMMVGMGNSLQVGNNYLRVESVNIRVELVIARLTNQYRGYQSFTGWNQSL